MGCHQYSIMLVQLQGNIIADIEAYYNIILMYVYNVYQGISSPHQFPDVDHYVLSPFITSTTPTMNPSRKNHISLALLVLSE